MFIHSQREWEEGGRRNRREDPYSPSVIILAVTGKAEGGLGGKPVPVLGGEACLPTGGGYLRSPPACPWKNILFILISLA